jgi:hypothetical protein
MTTQEINDKLTKAGFNQSTTAPTKPKEVMTESEVAVLKAKADAAAIEKAHQNEMARISREAKEKELATLKAQQLKDAELLAATKPTPAPVIDKPLESGIKIVSGQIVDYNAAGHALTVKDKAGVRHDFLWPGVIDAKMLKLKQWFFTTISAEKAGEYWKVVDTQYFAKPADWPVSQKAATGGKPFTPRNERIIVLQSCCKLAAEVFAITTCPDTVDFDAAMDCIIARAIKDTETLMQAGKVQP